MHCIFFSFCHCTNFSSVFVFCRREGIRLRRIALPPRHTRFHDPGWWFHPSKWSVVNGFARAVGWKLLFWCSWNWFELLTPSACRAFVLLSTSRNWRKVHIWIKVSRWKLYIEAHRPWNIEVSSSESLRNSVPNVVCSNFILFTFRLSSMANAGRNTNGSQVSLKSA